MNKVLYSSITKKFVMALAGFFLLLFLPVHLRINLLLLNENPVLFNRVAHFMATFPPIRIIEIMLFLSFFVHVAWGIFIQIQNWLSRPVRYSVWNKSDTSAFSKFMIWTGGSVMIFLIIHFFNFYFIRLGFVKGNPDDFYSVAHQLFSNNSYLILYLICFLLLGLHLYHAFKSAFQTLGLNHRIWTPVVKVFALVYAVAIPSGFTIIAVSIWFNR